MKWTRLARAIRETADISDDEAWLQTVMSVLTPELDAGLGVAAVRYDVSDPRAFRTEPLLGAGLPKELSAAQVVGATMQSHPLYIQATYRAVSCATPTEVGGLCEELFVEQTGSFGIFDALCINAILPNDVGCCFIAGRGKRTALNARTRERWQQVAGELRSAMEHRAIPSQNETRRRPLDMKRLTMSQAWSTLEEEGWLPIRAFAVGDRPFVLVGKSGPNTTTALTMRELEVAQLVAGGLTNKEVAYELGISASTVGVLLFRAMTKLGLKSRHELKRVFTGP